MCNRSFCIKWEIKGVETHSKIHDPNKKYTEDEEAAVKKALEDRLKSGTLDCDDPPAIPGIPHEDCNCIFPPGQDSEWKTSELVEAYQEDFKVGDKTYPVGYKQKFKYRVFVGGCYPVGTKIRWPAS
jgi:hypothetical protein